MNGGLAGTGLAVALAALSVLDPARSQQPQETEYAVYSAVIRQVVLAEGWAGNPRAARRPIGRVVIIAEPQGQLRVLSARMREQLPSLDSATESDFSNKKEAPPFERQFVGIGEYTLLSGAELANMPVTREWSTFYERFPDAPGTIHLSQVGLNPARTQALVKVTHLRASLFGQITLYMLEKNAEGWQVVGKVGLPGCDGR